jgi:hypothetical protein
MKKTRRIRRGGWLWKLFQRPKKKTASELMHDYRKNDCINAPVDNTTMSLANQLKHKDKIEPCDDIEKKINELPDQKITDDVYDEYVKFMHAANLRRYHQSKSNKQSRSIAKEKAVSKNKETRFFSQPYRYNHLLDSDELSRKYYTNKRLTSIQSTRKNINNI